MIYNLEKTLDEEFAKRELKGKLEGKLEVARKLLRKGFALAEVAEITELTLDEIEKNGTPQSLDKITRKLRLSAPWLETGRICHCMKRGV